MQKRVNQNQDDANLTKTLRTILILLILTSFLKVSGQTFDKTFTGQWAMTFWSFEFNKDGTYKRTSTGHYGNPTFQGTYKIYNDTIEIENGYDSSSGTLNKYYLISTYHSKFMTKQQGRIIDLTNLYEYYDNDRNSISQKNKIIKVEITDSLNRVQKSFNSYIPINYLTNKYNIDLSWCAEFYDYPANLKKAEIEKPNTLDKQGTKLDAFHFYDNQSRLIEYFYIGSKINGIKPETLNLEYFQGTKNVKKITDSKDGSNYNFEYDDNGNIMLIDYFTEDNKRINQLKVID